MVAGLFTTVLISIVFSTAFAIAFPGVFANQNAVQIDENGSLDSNKDYWHKMNVWIWIMATTPLSILPMLPIFCILRDYAFFAVLWIIAYGMWSRAVYWLLFDRRLNREMDKPDDYLGQTSKLDVALEDAKDIIQKKLYLVAVTTFVYLIISAFLLLRL